MRVSKRLREDTLTGFAGRFSVAANLYGNIPGRGQCTCGNLCTSI